MIFIILLLLIIILFVKIISDYNNIEHYDVKKDIADRDQCGAICTKELKCAGFGHDSTNKSCFLSKGFIMGKPSEGKFADQYLTSNADIQCNKIKKSNTITEDNIKLQDNSKYNCFNYNNKTSSIISYKPYQDNTAETLYTMEDTEFNNLEKTKSSQSIINTIYSTEDIDNIANDSLDNQISNAQTSNAQTSNAQTSNAQTSNVQTSNAQTSNTQKYGFIETDDEFVGMYMLKPECVSNVPLYDCIKYCDKETNCEGTEWNKSLTKKIDGIDNVFENVCCPKSNLTKVIERDSNNKGKFYMKADLDFIKDREQIHLTKADFTNKYKREAVSIN